MDVTKKLYDLTTEGKLKWDSDINGFKTILHNIDNRESN